MTGDFKRRNKVTDELSIYSVLLRDAYSEIKTKNPQIWNATVPWITAVPQ